MSNHVLIIGAGASGLMAGYSAAKSGARVTIIEKNHVPGRKILASGAGKCNLTNKNVSTRNYHLKNTAFIEKVFEILPPAKISGIFENMGLVLSHEPDGRVFPRCGKSKEVLDVLLNSIEEHGVKILTLTEVVEIKKKKPVFVLKTQSVKPPWHKGIFHPEPGELCADKVILAAGSNSYPQTGGCFRGYELATLLGHRVTELRPSLVPLRVQESFVKNLAGVRVNAKISIHISNKEISNSRGEILWTDYGISGPAALDVSRAVSFSIGRGKILGLINFFPEFEPGKVKAFLEDRWQKMKNKKWKVFLDGLFEEKLAGVITDVLKINPSKEISEIPPGMKESFLKLAREFKFEITGTMDFKDSMITAGGVNLSEINPETFESRIVPGLFLTGELLDIDGDSGGYNLHFAWTSGMIAGKSAGKFL
ncbi:MAG: NAD(P)/FAD-dependent oxidoreductase [Elusimicrobiota bacterium]